MRVALIQPPRTGGNYYSTVPVGLLALASYIKKYGYDPIIIDLNLFSVLEKDRSDILRRMAKKVLESKPEVLGFGVMCNTLPVALLVAHECKKLAPQIPIIFGGPEVSFEEEKILKTFKQVDIIVRGEGEKTLVEVLKSINDKSKLANVLGITFRDGNQIVKTAERPFIENLDELPFLDFSLLSKLKMYNIEIEAGRGCPYQCTFCSTCRMWKRKFRMKSAKRLVQELKHACRFSNDAYIGINHDHFLASRKFTNEFISLMKNQGISWGCNSRLDALDEELIEKLKVAGCRQIAIGIEAGSAEMQKALKKNIPLERLFRILESLFKNDIPVLVSFIIGFPNETESQISQTLLLALKVKIFYPEIEFQIFLFTFLKGSELFTEAKEKNKGYEFRETSYSSLTTDLPDELSLIKKYPHIFPSFYYIGEEAICSKLLQKINHLFVFLTRSYARPSLRLLEYLSVDCFHLGKMMSAFFDEEGVDWSAKKGYHFPQFVAPFRKFIRKYADPLYKDFFWWDQAFERWENQKGVKCSGQRKQKTDASR